MNELNKDMAQKRQAKKQSANRTVAFACLAFFVCMIGVAYASVPLYRLFCQVTGYGGTTQRVEQYSDKILDKKLKIRFDANTATDLPWDFKPMQREVEIRIGETTMIQYEATNYLDRPASGRATFNVTPARAGAYFNKVECFCFNDTTLQPGENMDMPVVFFIDPDFVNDPDLKSVQTITLSYTFFSADKDKPLAKAEIQ